MSLGAECAAWFRAVVAHWLCCPEQLGQAGLLSAVLVFCSSPVHLQAECCDLCSSVKGAL